MTWRTACQTAGSRPKQVVQHRWPRRQPPGQSTAIPKTAAGAVEMMRQLKITRDTAVKARTTAMHTLKRIVVHASPVLREALHNLTDHGLLTRCARLRPGPLDTPTASAKHTLRALARRWMALTEEGPFGQRARDEGPPQGTAARFQVLWQEAPRGGLRSQ